MKQLTKSNYGKQITTLQALVKLSDKAKKVIYKDKIYSAKFLLNTFKHSADERVKNAFIYKYKDKSSTIERPKYFVVERDRNNPLWQKYIKWLNNTYGTDYAGFCCRYYGYDGNNVLKSGTGLYDSISDFKNNPVLLTLEEWHRLFIENKKKVKKKQSKTITIRLIID